MAASRYSDRERYFNELHASSKKYYLDYVRRFRSIGPGCRVLEIGCGEGGNLLAFAEMGCSVYGLDIAEGKIRNARLFFEKRGAHGEFLCCNFLENREPFGAMKFDIIIVHDVIEHIEPEWKSRFFENVRYLLSDGGIVFWSFPDWYMPFGGHQQICRSRVCSHLPFVHILPASVYKAYLKLFGEAPATVDELLSIKRSKMTPRSFASFAAASGMETMDRTLWLINPHYEVKFGLTPHRMPDFLARIRGLRDFLATSCHFVTVAADRTDVLPLNI